MKVKKFEELAENCPWQQKGDCIGNMYNVDGYRASDQHELSFEGCQHNLCPFFYWVNLTEKYLKLCSE